MISIRHETQQDREAIRRVIVDAFSQSEFGYHGEAELVEKLRNDCDELLSLVAVDENEVAGYILFSPVTLIGNDGGVPGMGLAPMAVEPARQRTGIGTALIKAGLEQLANAGCSFVVVLGHPDYYPRFGFVPAADHGISHCFAGIPQDVFFIKGVTHLGERSIGGRRILYRPEFGVPTTL